MYVRNRMTANPYCISKDTSISTALDVMAEHGFHRLPVVEGKHLVGLVTEGVIAEHSPSKATSLSIYELNYLLSKTKCDSVMIKNVITISPDVLLEEAAVVMRKNKVGCLVVVENDEVVGIITHNDIFDSFVELYKSLPLLECGYTDANINIASPYDMEKYYSKEEQQKYGVVGIKISHM